MQNPKGKDLLDRLRDFQAAHPTYTFVQLSTPTATATFQTTPRVLADHHHPALGAVAGHLLVIGTRVLGRRMSDRARRALAHGLHSAALAVHPDGAGH